MVKTIEYAPVEHYNLIKKIYGEHSRPSRGSLSASQIGRCQLASYFSAKSGGGIFSSALNLGTFMHLALYYLGGAHDYSRECTPLVEQSFETAVAGMRVTGQPDIYFPLNGGVIGDIKTTSYYYYLDFETSGGFPLIRRQMSAYKKVLNDNGWPAGHCELWVYSKTRDKDPMPWGCIPDNELDYVWEREMVPRLENWVPAFDAAEGGDLSNLWLPGDDYQCRYCPHLLKCPRWRERVLEAWEMFPIPVRTELERYDETIAKYLGRALGDRGALMLHVDNEWIPTRELALAVGDRRPGDYPSNMRNLPEVRCSGESAFDAARAKREEFEARLRDEREASEPMDYGDADDELID